MKQRRVLLIINGQVVRFRTGEMEELSGKLDSPLKRYRLSLEMMDGEQVTAVCGEMKLAHRRSGRPVFEFGDIEALQLTRNTVYLSLYPSRRIIAINAP